MVRTMPGQQETSPERERGVILPVDQHMLSFDVEEYFQVEAAAADVCPERWYEYPRRLLPSVERILELLAEHNQRATFFVLGWVAANEGEVVRRIASAGQEIASHGMTHAMLGRLTPEQFRHELCDSRKLLEDLSGRPVAGYRAPTFSITRATAWAFDVLAEAGFRYDSSVFPIRHDRYGVPGAPRRPHLAIGPGGGRMLELPLLTLQFGPLRIPVAGGGYLRLFPLRLVTAGLRQAARAGSPGMIYLHPWELDPDQPVLPMGRLNRFRHRVGLARTHEKLRRLLRSFRFAAVEDFLPRLEPTLLPTVSYAAEG